MGQITLDYQLTEKACAHCEALFLTARGSVYEDRQPVGLYLASMHACRSTDRLVHLAIAFRKGYVGLAENSALAIKARLGVEGVNMTVIDWKNSPWITELYLGNMLDRKEGLGSSLIQFYYHIADHIVEEIPSVNQYLIEGRK